MLKILADPLFPEGIVEELKQAGYDAVHAVEIGAGDLPLRELTRLAVFEDRILVSANRVLAMLVETTPEPKPSLVYFKALQGGTDALSHVLLNLLALFDGDLAEGAVVIVRDGQTLLRKYSHPR